MQLKYIFALIVIMTVLGTVTLVSADDNVNVAGIDFNIPEGFEENTTYTGQVYSDGDYVDVEYNTYTDGSDSIEIMVKTAPEGKEYTSLEPGEGDYSKTINGIDGYYNDDIEGYECFTFIKDGKNISVLSNNGDLIEKVIN